jgi:hypothetical protein
MTVLASNQIPADAYTEFKRLCNRLDTKCAEWLTLLGANIDADQVWTWYRELYWAWTRLNEISAVPGIVEYAIIQEADPDYDVATEFVAMMGQLQTAHQWLYAAIPRDANGYTLTHTTTVEGERVARVFTPAQSAPFATYLQAIAAAIV